MNIEFLEIALLEFTYGVSYYNEEMPGLGSDFIFEVEKALERVKLYPEAWSHISENFYRILIRRFPYGIVYKLEKKEIIVYAIMHLKRDPEKLKKRIS